MEIEGVSGEKTDGQKWRKEQDDDDSRANSDNN